MKPTTKMSRTVQMLETIYKTVNDDLFEGKLPMCIITVQTTPGGYGHSSRSKIWNSANEDRYELNIDTETLSLPIEETLDTMIHEMIHLYCRENNIQETSRGGYYHNAKFKELAIGKHLQVEQTGKYGWNTVAKDNVWLTEYALSRGFDDFKISKRGATKVISGSATGIKFPTEDQEGPKQSSTRKYQCPKCKNSVRATKDLFIICGDCEERMLKV